MNQEALHPTHPDAESLNAFAEQALPEEERGLILSHLGACSRCRQIVFLAQDSSASMEWAEPPQPVAAEPTSGPGAEAPARSWFWRQAWIPAAAMAAILAVAYAVHVRQLQRPVELARVAPQFDRAEPGMARSPITQTARMEDAAAPAHGETTTKSARQAPAAAGLGGIASSQQDSSSHLAESDTVQPARIAGNSSAMRPALLAEPDAASQPAPPGQASFAEWPQQPMAGVVESFTGTTKAPGQLPAESRTERTQAKRGMNSAAFAQPLESRPGAAASFGVEALRQQAGTPALYRTRNVALPNGKISVSMAELGRKALTVDKAGVLYVSDDAGAHWDQVAPQWSGRAIAVRVKQVPGGKTTALEPASFPAVFELANEDGLAWMSADGRSWKAE